MSSFRILAVLGTAIVAGCTAPPRPPAASVWPEPERALTGIALESAVARDHAARARDAYARLEAAPDDLDAAIWYGRRLAYLGRYEDAVAVYDAALAYHPSSPYLLRHRGHRMITLRRFDAAVRDLERAVRIIEGEPDVIEPDGIPNARGVPTSTLHTNVWYHLGLAHYCRGEFDEALYAYQRCVDAATNPDMEAAARYWLYLTATRLGDLELARRALQPVRVDWDIIENHAYHRLLLLYRGDASYAEVRHAGSGDAVQDATLDYGLARWHFLRGERAAGIAALQRLAALDSPAFGCIAAEADLARTR